MFKLKRKQQKELTRFGEYMVGGGLWFWSGYAIIVYLNGRMPLFWVNFIGNAVGITLNFLVERYWAFKVKRQSTLLIATWRYIIYTVLNAFLLNYLILAVLIKQFNIQPKIGQFIAAGFFTIWNYIWYKLWVFRGQDRHKRIRHHA
ncbi:MAG TPA: GtrA family protein [Candidatus Saccharimonadales bacterium]|nr:GtrA family protein [Candidatus Saccharimonadales bacterium]